jgi:hypothetical protein
MMPHPAGPLQVKNVRFRALFQPNGAGDGDPAG